MTQHICIAGTPADNWCSGQDLTIVHHPENVCSCEIVSTTHQSRGGFPPWGPGTPHGNGTFNITVLEESSLALKDEMMKK